MLDIKTNTTSPYSLKENNVNLVELLNGLVVTRDRARRKGEQTKIKRDF